VVQRIYEMYTVQGFSIGGITRRLNAESIPTRKESARWERSTVWAVWRNPAYRGRKAGKGRFTFRGAPASAVTKGPSQPVPVTITQCPCCGGALHWERTDEVTVTDMPERPQPEIKRYAAEVRRCEAC